MYIGKGIPLHFDNVDFVHVVNETEDATLCGVTLGIEDDIRFEGIPQAQTTRLCFNCMTHAVFNTLPTREV